jgi:hypothetical protein
MSRFKELQEKGWTKLNSDERKEYSALKRGSAEADEAYKGSTPVAKVENKTVTLTAQELDELITSRLDSALAENQALKQKHQERNDTMGLGEWEEEKELSPQTRFTNQSLYRETEEDEFGLIVGCKRIKILYYDGTDRIRDQIYRISLLYPDGTTEEKEVPLGRFTKLSTKEELKIIDRDIKKSTKIHGYVKKSTIDKEGYMRSLNQIGLGVDGTAQGDQVALKETRDVGTVTVQRPSGQTYTMDINSLGI